MPLPEDDAEIGDAEAFLRIAAWLPEADRAWKELVASGAVDPLNRKRGLVILCTVIAAAVAGSGAPARPAGGRERSGAGR
jgi:hypothetical protein